MTVDDPNQPLASSGLSGVIRFLTIVSLTISVGCSANCAERLETDWFEYQWSPKFSKQEKLETLRRTLRFCEIPKEGVSDKFENVHAAQLLFVVGRYDDAAAAIGSDDFVLTDGQKFDILSFAVMAEDSQILDIVLSSRIDPNIRQPRLETTALMHASQASIGSVDRMRRLVELGNDPLAVQENGFSVLDFAMSAENDDAVDLVLDWFAAVAPNANAHVRFSLDIAERSHLDGYVSKLNLWLAQQEGDEIQGDE